jgi:hypothetical protein
MKELLAPGDYRHGTSISNLYGVMTIYSPFQVNIYALNSLNYITTIREPDIMSDIAEVKILSSDLILLITDT